MAATFLPSNFVTPNPKIGVNPNWTLSEQAVPVQSVYTEPVYDRVLVGVGRHPTTIENAIPQQGVYIGDQSGIAIEEDGRFTITNVNLQNASGIMLEEVYFNTPLTARRLGRNVTGDVTECGSIVGDANSEPRRFVFREYDLNIFMNIAGRMHFADITKFLPYGRSIAWYTLDEIITYLIGAVTHYMHNQLGDSSFTMSTYVDASGPRLFWKSDVYPPSTIRFIFSDFQEAAPHFLQLFLNHFYVSDARVPDSNPDTLETNGESLGISARQETKHQNNALYTTIHIPELTQFRKGDSSAPVEGSSLVGVCLPQVVSESDDAMSLRASIKDGTLCSPKIAFDRSQSILSFEVYLRTIVGQRNETVYFKPIELFNTSIALIFRVW